jgi:hypothetical protein
MNEKNTKQIEDDKKILQEVLESWEKDSLVDKTQPNDTISEIGRLHAKYLRILATHKLNVKHAENEFLDMKRIRSAYYDGALDKSELDKRGWEPYLGKTLKFQGQKESILETDEYLLTILLRKAIYEEIVEVCQFILKELNNRTWSLREFMQWERSIRNG